MKLIEAMKELKLIQKRIDRNKEQIRQHAAYHTVAGPAFGNGDVEKGDAEQRETVRKLLQSSFDLVQRSLDLKAAIDRTNLDTLLEHKGKTHSIHALIILRRQLGQQIVQVIASQTPEPAINQLNNVLRQGIDATNPPRLIQCFDEAKRNEDMKFWQEFVEEIDARLEVVNATTDVIGLTH